MARRRSVTDQEYRDFANEFVDMLLDPRKEWLFTFIMAGGLKRLPTQQDLESGLLVARITQLVHERSWFAPADIGEAYLASKREPLVDWIFNRTREVGLSKEELSRVLAIGNDAVLQRSLRELASQFTFKRGPKSKVPLGKYSELLRTADLLKPCLAKLLSELDAQTKHSVHEVLEYTKADFPKASAFLLRHLSRLVTAINDSDLVGRAKKPATRARLLADALAASDYGVSFRTSLARVTEARRSSKPVDQRSRRKFPN